MAARPDVAGPFSAQLVHMADEWEAANAGWTGASTPGSNSSGHMTLRKVPAEAVDNAEPQACEKCHVVFPGAGDLFNHHITSQHFTTYCCLCQKTFSERYKLKRHIDSFHGCGRTYGCWVCDKKLNRQDRLQDHLVRAHGLHACGKCKATFQHREELLSHKQFHHFVEDK